MHARLLGWGCKLWPPHTRWARSSRASPPCRHPHPHPILPPRRQVFLTASAVGYYGYDGGDQAFDESGPLGSGFLAEVTRVWEAEAQKLQGKRVSVVLPMCRLVCSRVVGDRFCPLGGDVRLQRKLLQTCSLFAAVILVG